MKFNILFLLLLLSFISCEKDVDEFTPYHKTTIVWPEVLDLHTTSISFLAEMDSEIQLGEGEILIIPANSVVGSNGQLLMGKVDLSLTYIRKKADLIYAYLNSNTPNTSVINHHIINIKGYQDTHPVNIKAGKTIKIKTPTNSQINTGKTWIGDNTAPNKFIWESTPNQLSKESWVSSGQSYSGIVYGASQFGWISGASELPTQEHKLCVNFIEGFDQEKTKVFFIYLNQFVVAELKSHSDSQQFCTFVPDNTAGHIIIINQDGNTYSYQKEMITITEDFDFSGHPVVTVLENIVLDLNKL